MKKFTVLVLAFCLLAPIGLVQAQDGIKFPREAAWPVVVKLTQPTALAGAGGKVIITKPVGTEVDAVMSPDRSTLAILVKGTDLRASVPVDKTDFMELATAKEEQMHKADLQADSDLAAAQKKREDDEKAEKKRLTDQFDANYGEALNEKVIYGREPYWRANGVAGAAIPTLVMRNLKRRLNDPSSLLIREVARPVHDEFAGVKCWKITFLFSAKNGFGGMKTQRAVALVREGDLLDLNILGEND